jgi:Domain of unknown function (DUF1917)
MSYSEKLYESRQKVSYDSRLPSKTLKHQDKWIYVSNPRSAEFEEQSPDLYALPSAWDKIRAEGLSSSLSEIDKLAKQFNILPGKWLVFVSSDEVDKLWGRIVNSTLAGTLGISTKVSTRDKNDPRFKHVICVYNADYTSMAEVNGVRDELRRLGVEERIGYKPDIYTLCGIYHRNNWGIPPCRYFS